MAFTKCPKCGQDISETEKKCIHCGYVFTEEAVTKRFCIDCGKEVSMTDKYCSYCSFPLYNETVEYNA